MTKEEAIAYWKQRSKHIHDWLTHNEDAWFVAEYVEAIDMAIDALQTDIVRCENCTHQDECEEIVVFEISDDEVMGHRVHWCSYGRSEE